MRETSKEIVLLIITRWGKPAQGVIMEYIYQCMTTHLYCVHVELYHEKATITKQWICNLLCNQTITNYSNEVKNRHVQFGSLTSLGKGQNNDGLPTGNVWAKSITKPLKV